VTALGSLVVSCLGLGACSSATPSDGIDESEKVDVASIEPGLALGARGAQVEALTARLVRLGYLPSAELAQQFPGWMPVVPDAPADAAHFGPELERAVIAFQQRTRMAPTGIVDAATVKALGDMTCGHPESGHLDETEKWSLPNPAGKWQSTTITYKLSQNSTQLNASAALQAAFQTWANASNLNFVPTTSATPDIEVKFYTSPPPAGFPDVTGFGGVATGPCNPGSGCNSRIGVNDGTNWTSGPPSSYDLQGLLTHEIGHTLGLDHSSIHTFGDPVMFTPWSNSDLHRTLLPDDLTAVGAIYGAWQVQALPAGLTAVDVGGTGNDLLVASASNVSQWNGSAWTQFTGPSGVTLTAIAAGGGGTPWVVATNGTIWSRSGSSWTQRPGTATDIGIGPFNQTWAVGTVSQGAGNFDILQWNGSGWTSVVGAAKRVAVDLFGRPWVVQNSGAIFRRNAAGNGWDLIGGCASDIGAGLDGSIWALGCNAVQGTEREVFVLDEQLADTVHGPAPAEFKWVGVANGLGSRIAVGPTQKAWTTLSGGALTRRLTRCPSPPGFCG
jgi:peptidoglycan hydrolase-like protein with peptidoglycan-binding domain